MFFEGSKLPLRKLLGLIYMWAYSVPLSTTTTFLGVSSATVVQWFHYCRYMKFCIHIIGLTYTYSTLLRIPSSFTACELLYYCLCFWMWSFWFWTCCYVSFNFLLAIYRVMLFIAVTSAAGSCCRSGCSWAACTRRCRSTSRSFSKPSTTEAGSWGHGNVGYSASMIQRRMKATYSLWTIAQQLIVHKLYVACYLSYVSSFQVCLFIILSSSKIRHQHRIRLVNEIVQTLRIPSVRQSRKYCRYWPLDLSLFPFVGV